MGKIEVGRITGAPEFQPCPVSTGPENVEFDDFAPRFSSCKYGLENSMDFAVACHHELQGRQALLLHNKREREPAVSYPADQVRKLQVNLVWEFD